MATLALSPGKLGGWARAVAPTHPSLMFRQGCVLQSFSSQLRVWQCDMDGDGETGTGKSYGSRLCPWGAVTTHHQHTTAFRGWGIGLVGWLESGGPGVESLKDESRAGQPFSASPREVTTVLDLGVTDQCKLHFSEPHLETGNDASLWECCHD